MADVERIDRSQRHLLALINDVLNFARLDAGRVVFEVRDVAAAEIVGGLHEIFAPQLRAKQLRFSTEIRDDALVVRADPERAHQVLANLLSNAVKFTAAGGEIAVTCEAEGDFVAFHVRDTGVGIPTEKLEAVFEPFVQLRRTLAQPGEGTGLGLAISRDLARGMGGDLTVTSIENRGSTFTLALPRVERR
jgi:signal transduction histidine kinase